MARPIDTERALKKLTALYEAEDKLVGLLRRNDVGALRIAKAMHTSPQAIAKRFPGAVPAARSGGRTAAGPRRAAAVTPARAKRATAKRTPAGGATKRKALAGAAR